MRFNEKMGKEEKIHIFTQYNILNWLFTVLKTSLILTRILAFNSVVKLYFLHHIKTMQIYYTLFLKSKKSL